MIGLESRPRSVDRVAVQRVDGQAILLHVDTGRYYSLDEVSGQIWDLCDGNHSVAAITAEVCREYEAPADAVERDVLAFLMKMAEERLLFFV
jgi:hypothetical protein